MKTRKDFILGGLGTLAVPYIGRSEPRRSMLGAVGTDDDGSSDWVNPYVTDGMIAMWDGEWNMGGGVHISETMKWKDICGNEPDLTPSDSLTPLEFSDRGLVTNSVIPQNSTSGRLFNNTASSYTVECGFLNLRLNYNFPAFSNGKAGSTNGTRIVSYSFSVPPGNNTPVLCNVNNTQYNLSSTISVGDKTSFSISYDGSSAGVYHNGVLDSTVGIGTSNPLTLLTIGGYLSWGNAYTEGCYSEYYFFRIYSRSLTAAEIAYNYSIDKERFGIM